MSAPVVVTGSGLLAGVWTGLSLDTRFPVHFRMGAGTMLGTILDSRRGTLSLSSGSNRSFGGVAELHDAHFIYFEPEVRIGLTLSPHVELGAGLGVLVLVALSQPSWNDKHAINAGSDGYATFAADALAGDVLLVLAPGLGARYDF